MVAADSVALSGQLTVFEGSKSTAVAASARALEAFTAELADLGGEALTPATTRHPLTWSAHSADTQVEREHNPKTGRHEPTGRVIAWVGLEISVRDFGLLESLGAVFARHEALNVASVTWSVDDDNQAWPVVRAAAIEAARGSRRCPGGDGPVVLPLKAGPARPSRPGPR